MLGRKQMHYPISRYADVHTHTHTRYDSHTYTEQKMIDFVVRK